MKLIKSTEEKLRTKVVSIASDWHLEYQKLNIADLITEKINDFRFTTKLPIRQPTRQTKPKQASITCPKLLEAYNQWFARVGKEVYVGSWHTITQGAIDSFAAVTEDEQWIHTDPVKAQDESPYGTTIAHGMLVLSLIPKLTGIFSKENLLFSNTSMIINYGLNKVRFHQAVPVNSELRARITPVDVSVVKKSIKLVNKITVDINGENRPACVIESVLILHI
jgi:acyl dehydratase